MVSDEELVLGHVDPLYLSSTGEPNRERRPVAGGSSACYRRLEPSCGVPRIGCPIAVEEGKVQWNFPL